jgi:D-glycerate 3-kinase
MGEETSDLIVSHIRSILSSTAREAQTAPLFVGLQGPQGIGKTTITRNLLSSLQDLRLAVLSIDDFYLSYSGLEDLAKRHVNNGLLKGRGQPGTHDIALLQSVLDQLSRINDNPDSIVEIPIFDKSLHEGKGDRLPKGHIVKGPLDIVILEGWCVGFYNLPHDDLESRFRSINSGHPSSDNLDAENKTLERDIVGAHRLEDIQEVNAYLRSYGLMYPNFTTFIQVECFILKFSLPHLILLPIALAPT